MPNDTTTEADLASQLVGVFDTLAEAHPDDLSGEMAEFAESLVSVRTLAAGGWLTLNEGVELEFGDGSRFLLTVQEVRR